MAVGVAMVTGGAALAARLAKAPDAHKYVHGHVLVLAGPSGKGGAARLAARAALRVGAGLVTLGVPHAALVENAAQLTAIMLTEIDEAGALEAALSDRRLNALCLGPGLGRARARALVPVALAARRSAVLDADALTAYANDPGQLFEKTHENCVMTPHEGEFARLFPDLATREDIGRVERVRTAAARAGCVVLLKGPQTIIAAPTGEVAMHVATEAHAAPWLATAGAGDVLAGLIAGLMARGQGTKQAAGDATWLHAECARAFGPGLIAEDLPEMLPKVLRTLGV